MKQQPTRSSAGAAGTTTATSNRSVDSRKSAQRAQLAPQCLAGRKDIRILADQIDGRSAVGNDRFLRDWRRIRTSGVAKVSSPTVDAALGAKSCSDQNPNALTQMRDLRDAINKIDFARVFPSSAISRRCVESAVRRSGNLLGAKNCRSDTDTPRKLSGIPCVTPSYVDYVTFATNEAIRCLSRPTHPVNPQVVFSKINNESAFASFAGGPGGSGLTQITSAAALEMSPGGDGFKFLSAIMRENQKLCRNFESTLNLPLQLNKIGEARNCQFMSVGGGVPRSLLYGIGLHLYYRDGIRGHTTARLTRLGLERNPDLLKMADYLALVSFSASGPTGAAEALEKIKSRITPKTRFAEFKALLDEQSDYLRAIDAKMVEVFGRSDANCVEAS